jgi:hypothetical protein
MFKYGPLAVYATCVALTAVFIIAIPKFSESKAAALEAQHPTFDKVVFFRETATKLCFVEFIGDGSFNGRHNFAINQVPCSSIPDDQLVTLKHGQ